jgi:hypothetical protein
MKTQTLMPSASVFVVGDKGLMRSAPAAFWGDGSFVRWSVSRAGIHSALSDSCEWCAEAEAFQVGCCPHGGDTHSA